MGYGLDTAGQNMKLFSINIYQHLLTYVCGKLVIKPIIQLESSHPSHTFCETVELTPSWRMLRHISEESENLADSSGLTRLVWEIWPFQGWDFEDLHKALKARSWETENYQAKPHMIEYVRTSISKSEPHFMGCPVSC